MGFDLTALNWPIMLNGFLLSLGLIVAIGPQNAYVLRKGLKRRHVFGVATACFLSDSLLILIAVAGVGGFLASNPTFATWAGWGGAAFLLWYGGQSLKNAMHPDVITDKSIEEAGADARGKGLWAAILLVMMFTFLNPHALLDTLVIIGGIAAHYETDAGRWSFGIGAIMASGVWFYSIGYGARFLAPIFRKAIAWRILDLMITLVMWSVAAGLVWHQLNGGSLH